MNKKVLNNMEFITESDEGVNINFSTAYNKVDYKKERIEGKGNIETLKEVFNIKDTYYINQIHSDIVVDASNISHKGEVDGDAIVYKGENIAVGVFTADCVPVIIYDKEKKVISAVHSGWKGTYDEITKKTCEYMKNTYGCNELKIVIGPHIKKCCYEVSEELVEKFKDKFGTGINENRNLNLEQCIFNQVKGIVKDENIKSLGICTYCNKEVELHSYRVQKENSGRLFSFVFVK